MSTAPIGVFDSGLGGLTAVRELRRILPGEDIVYFGDTGRVPYGNRSVETLIKFARQDAGFLLTKKIKALVAACGTVSSTLPPAVSKGFPVPFMGIIPPACHAAAAATKNKKVGVVATESAIGSGCYQETLARLDPAIDTVAKACPLFVPLVEYGHFALGDAMARLAIEEYLAPLLRAKVDTLILGCTHYSLLAPAIAQYMGPDVTLIDAGRETALALKENLARKELLSGKEDGGQVRYFVSANMARFDQLASLFLGESTRGQVEQINIEDYYI